MEFRIADTFTDSLARLTGEEQKAVKTTAFDLQLNPAHPGMQFHKLDKPKDPNFWSVRVSQRHAADRSPERAQACCSATSTTTTPPTSGPSGASWRRTRRPAPRSSSRSARPCREIVVPEVRRGRAAGGRRKPPLFAGSADDELLGLRRAGRMAAPMCASATEDTCWSWPTICRARPPRRCWNSRPAGRRSRPAGRAPAPIRSPTPMPAPLPRDDQRRGTGRALDYPWEKWTVFLHPAQRQLVERDYSGPARVSGSAGTGKTIVALHRAVYLAGANPEARVLLTTFSDTLANALRCEAARG